MDFLIILILPFALLIAFVLLFLLYDILCRRFSQIKRRGSVDSRALRLVKEKYGMIISAINSNKEIQEYEKNNERPNKAYYTNSQQPQVFRSMDALMDDYLSMDNKQRVAVRFLMSHSFYALALYQDRAREMLVTTRQHVWLLRALAAISIENCQLDYRDSITILESLISAAERIGIDWRNPACIIADYSDDLEYGGGQWKSTKAYLRSRSKSKNFLLEE